MRRSPVVVLSNGQRRAVDLSLGRVDLVRELSEAAAALHQPGLVLLQQAVELAALLRLEILEGLGFGRRGATRRRAHM